MTRAGFFALILIVAAGCENPFTTRVPEPPEQNNSNFISPSIPEIVFVNLQITVKDRNVENYMRSFVDTTRSDKRFTFVPDQGVAANRPGTFTDWSFHDERRYLNRVFQATPSDSIRNLNFEEVQRDERTAMAIFTQDYEIIIHHTRQSENIPVVFRGQSKFWLEVNNAGDWAIYKWEDFNNGQDPSWSELKALFQ